MPGQPYNGRSGISKKQRIIGSQIAEYFGQEFRTDRLDPRTFINIMLQEIVESVRFRDAPLEKVPVSFFPHALEQHSECGLDVADQSKINIRAAPNMLRVLVNLDFFYFVAGEE